MQPPCSGLADGLTLWVCLIVFYLYLHWGHASGKTSAWVVICSSYCIASGSTEFFSLFLYWWHYIWLLGWDLSTKSPHCLGNFSLCNIYLKVLVTILFFTSFHPTILTIDGWSLSESIIALESQNGINTFAIPPFLLHLLAEILSKRNFLLHTHFLM